MGVHELLLDLKLIQSFSALEAEVVVWGPCRFHDGVVELVAVGGGEGKAFHYLNLFFYFCN